MNQGLIKECQEKLLSAKEQTLKQLLSIRSELSVKNEASGDEVDLSQNNLAETHLYSVSMRLRKQLVEIESALSRLHTGKFGTCELTEEPIEEERLKTIPWTRFSIEGAEIKEALSKKYA